MATTHRDLRLCSAFALAAAAWHCNNSGSQNTPTPDLATPSEDLAMSAPDLANPPPLTLTSISPTVAPNAAVTNVTIGGTGIAAGATVSIAGTACNQVTVAFDGSLLTCQAAGKPLTCGAVPVVVTNPDGKSAMLSGFSYASKQFAFAAAKNIANGSGSREVAWADFNGDGKNDLVNLNGAAQTTISVQLGNGDGTFTSKSTDLGTGKIPAAIAAGDIDNDGTPDLVALINTSGGAGGQPQVVSLLGQKDGTFKAHAGAPANLTQGSAPTAIALGIADNKAKPYIVVSTTIGGKAAIEQLSNDGTGAMINLSTTIFGAAGTSANHLALADI